MNEKNLHVIFLLSICWLLYEINNMLAFLSKYVIKSIVFESMQHKVMQNLKISIINIRTIITVSKKNKL